MDGRKMADTPSPRVPKEPSPYTPDYMLNELVHHQTLEREISGHVLQRVNLHIAIVSGAFAVIALLGPGLAINQMLFFILSIIFATILILGLLLYAEMVQWVIAMILVDRATARIKRYFNDHDPELEKYVGEPTDDRPYHTKRRNLAEVLNTDLGSKQIVTILNNIVGAATGACLVLGLAPGNYQLAVLVGGGVFVAIWTLQFYYARMRYRLTEVSNKWKIRFPRSSR